MDLDLLKEKLKEKGLDALEGNVHILYECIKEWLAGEAPKHENNLVKMIPVVVAALDPIIMEYIDKIDGKEG